MNRRETREQAFILLFEKSFNPDSDINDIIALAEEARLFERNDFLIALVTTACDNMGKLDEHISRNARGWRVERIPKVSLAVLRLALTEMLYFDDIPAGASINEAVELCKTYATQKDSAFVNGLLSTVAKELKAKE